jgi:hypothetical protein
MFLCGSASRVRAVVRIRIPRTTRRANSNTSGAMTQEATAQTTMTGPKEAENVLTQPIEKMENTSRHKKLMPLCAGIYAGIVTVTYVGYIYVDGRDALLAHRASWNYNHSGQPMDTRYNNEYHAVVKGCKNNLLERFFQSVFFPYTIVASIMPKTIMYMNQPTDKDKEKEKAATENQTPNKGTT